jgi:hypothetical protein
MAEKPATAGVPSQAKRFVQDKSFREQEVTK